MHTAKMEHERRQGMVSPSALIPMFPRQVPRQTGVLVVFLILLQCLPCQTIVLGTAPTRSSLQPGIQGSPTPTPTTLPSPVVVRQLSSMDLDQPEETNGGNNDDGDEADEKGSVVTQGIAGNLVPDPPVHGPPPGVDDPVISIGPVTVITSTGAASATAASSVSPSPVNGPSSSSQAPTSPRGPSSVSSSVVTSSTLSTSSSTSLSSNKESTTSVSQTVPPQAPSSIHLIDSACGPTFSFDFNFTPTTTPTRAASATLPHTPFPPADHCEVTVRPLDVRAATKTPALKSPSPSAARIAAAAAAAGEGTIDLASSQVTTNSSVRCVRVDLHGLLYATPYVMKVVAVREVGRNALRSAPVSFNFTTASKLVDVEELQTSKVTSNSATLTWRPWKAWFDKSVAYHVQIKTSTTCFRYSILAARSDSFPAPVLPDKDDNTQNNNPNSGPQGSGCSVHQWDSGPFNGQIVIPRLEACTTYDAIVTSYCRCFCNASKLVSFTTLSDAPPRIVGLHAMSNSSQTVTALWSVSEASGVCGDVSYRLTLLDADNNDNEVKHIGIHEAIKNGSMSHTFRGLFSYHQYKVHVKATSNGGASVGVTSEVVRTDHPRPGKVRNFQATAVEGSNGRSMNVTWDSPRRPNDVLPSYVVRLRRSKDGLCLVAFHVLPDIDKGEHKNLEDEENGNTPCSKHETSHGDLTSPYLVITDLLPDTEYTVNITAVNDFGAEQSKVFGMRTPVIVPSAPTDVKVVEMTSTTVKLSWNPPVPRPGPTDYDVQVTDLGSPYQGQPFDGGQRTSNCSSPDDDSYKVSYCVVSDLQPYWMYNFSVTASTEKGTSPPALVDQLVITQSSAPGRVQTVQVQAVTGNYTDVIVTWACPPLNQRNTNITEFAVRAVQIQAEAETNSTMEVLYVASCSCDNNISAVVGVVPEHDYVFQVLSLSSDCNATQWTDSLPFKATIGPSNAVSHLVVTPASTSLTVTWDPPDQPNGRIIAYLITLTNDSSICFRDRIVWDSEIEPRLITTDCIQHDADVFHKQAGGTGESDHHVQTLEGLRAETRVNVTVTPYNHHGPGQPSSEAVLLEPSMSEPVSDLVVVFTTAIDVTLEWSSPAMTNGHLLKYGVLVEDAQRPCIRWLDVLLDGVDLDQMPVDMNGRDVDCPASNKINTTVDPSNRIKVTVTGLYPDDNVTITVYPYNRAGWGLPRSVKAHTEESAPNAPQHLHVNILNATYMWVIWDPPVPRPGHTTYYVDISKATSDDPLSGQFRHYRRFTWTGWNKTLLAVGDLWSGWRYSITVTASTAKGSRKIQIDPITMPETPPGNVRNFAVVPAENNYRKLLVTWDYPALKERHGRIVSFTIQYQNDKAETVLCLETNCTCPQTSPQFCTSLPVAPGVTYTVKIAANNQFRGVESKQICKARTGPPPPITEVPTTQPSAPDSQSTISVAYCATCLLDDTNGEIIYLALLVCSAEYSSKVNVSNLGSQNAIRQLPSWHDAYTDDFKVLYRPTDGDWATSVRAMFVLAISREVSHNSRSRRASEGQSAGRRRAKQAVYVVGQDAQCVHQPATSHCNGPLPAGRAFRVMTVSCTENSCTASALSEPLRTLSTDDSTNPTLVVIGCVLGVATACLVVVVVIWYRRNRAAVKSGDKDGSDDEGEEMPEMPQQNKRPIPMQEFEDRLHEWKTKLCPDSSLPLTLVQQFREIRLLSPKYDCTTAKLDDNRRKNRYCDILPFDQSRVKLIQLDDDLTTDYINANYLPGFTSKREYIATQGPLEGTVDDFWRMVWETSSPVIVMLSGLTEGRLHKVYKYYPDEDQLQKPCIYDLVEVTLQSVSHHEHYLVRTFKLAVGDRSRLVKQFYVFDWKDFDANLTANLVLEFVRAVRNAVPVDNKKPLIVHCSAGVGRTGTWIAIDYFMHYIRQHSLSASIDIFNFVLTLRESRVSMVQAAEQYAFLHDVLGELVRRKMEVDRYDEPVYANVSQIHYANKAYEHDENDYVNLQDVQTAISGSSISTGPSVKAKPKGSTSVDSARSKSSRRSSGKRNEKTETSRM